MSTYDLLSEAIEGKMQVTAYYDGYYREMCPPALGRKRGEVHCLFYQFAGESSSGSIVTGSPANWRCLKVDKLEDVHTRDGEWHTADNHSRPSVCFDVDGVDTEVDF